MKQSDGWSGPYAASLAINKSYLRQLNAFDKLISSIPPTPLLSKLFFQFFYHKNKIMLGAVTLSESTLIFRVNLIKLTVHLIKNTSFINFGKNGEDTNGTIIFDIKFTLLFINGYNVSVFQFWGKNWTEQWVIEVMMYKVRKHVIVWFYYFHRESFSWHVFFAPKFCNDFSWVV